MKGQRTVQFKNILAYGLGDFYGGGSFLIISLFFLYFLTEVAGIAPWLAGIVVGAGKVWDALAAPLMGYISDNTDTRHGRRRIYLIMGIMPIAVSFILLWLPVQWDNQYYKALYYTVAYIFFCSVFTMVMVPYSALNADMSADYKVRTRLSGARIFFSTGAALLAGTLPDIIIHKISGDAIKLLVPLRDFMAAASGGAETFAEKADIFSHAARAAHVPGIDCASFADRAAAAQALGGHDALLAVLKNFHDVLGVQVHTGYTVMGLVFGILFALPWIAVFLGTWEEGNPCADKKCRHTPFDVIKGLGSIFRNKSFRKHIAMYIAAYTAMDILLVMLKFYFDYNLGRESLSSAAVAVIVASQIIAIPLYVFIANRKGKAYAYRIGLGIWGIGMVLVFSVSSSSSLTIIFAVCALIGLGLSAGAMIPWAMMPTVVDADEIITGEKRAGVYAGAMSFARKMVQGLVILPLLGQALTYIHFNPGSAQSVETLYGMKLLFIALPCVFIAFGFAVSLTFKITPAAHTILTEEIARLKNGGSKNDVFPAVKVIVEEITGIPYEKLYRKS